MILGVWEFNGNCRRSFTKTCAIISSKSFEKCSNFRALQANIYGIYFDIVLENTVESQLSITKNGALHLF